MPSGARARRVMRVFLAVPPTGRFTRQLTTALDPVRDRLPLKWVAPVNWHVTLQFLGDWPAERVDGLKHALANGTWGAPFNLRPGAVGAFPGWRGPRVLFLHLESDGRLEDLAVQVRQTVAACWPDGPRDTRPLKSHLTLARIKATLSQDNLELLCSMELSGLPEIPVEGFSLVASRLTPQGPIYSELGYFGLHGI